MACFSSLVQKLVEEAASFQCSVLREEDEAGARQCQEGDLPGGGARVVGVVVELVYDDVVHFGERLDRDGVVGAAALAEGFELEGEGDEGFPGASGGVEDDVVADEEFENGFFLVVVGLGVCGGEVFQKNVEDVVRGGVFGEIFAAERSGHEETVDEEEFAAKAQRTGRSRFSMSPGHPAIHGGWASGGWFSSRSCRFLSWSMLPRPKWPRA